MPIVSLGLISKFLWPHKRLVCVWSKSEESKDKPLEFTCCITEIQEKKRPILEEAFFQRFGAAIKTEADFTKFVEDEIQKEKEESLAVKYRGVIKEQIQKLLTFDIPTSLLESEKEGQKETINRDNPDLSDEEKNKLADEQALNYIRFQRFLSVKKEKEDLQIDDNLVRQRFMFAAQMMKMNPNELLQQEYGKQVYQSAYLTLLEEVVLNDIVGKIA